MAWPGEPRLATPDEQPPTRGLFRLSQRLGERNMMRSSPRRAKRTTTDRELARLEDIPNVGPAVAGDLRQLGITEPADLPGRDPYQMYDDLCRLTGQRHDPCLLDTFIAAVRFMRGEQNIGDNADSASRGAGLEPPPRNPPERYPCVRSEE